MNRLQGGGREPNAAKGRPEQVQPPRGAAKHTQWRAWGLFIPAGAAGLALPDRRRSGPLGGQRSTRSDKRGGLSYSVRQPKFRVVAQFVEDQRIGLLAKTPVHHEDDDFQVIQRDGVSGGGHRADNDDLPHMRRQYA
jgi:hypothetical protein